jgi:dolichol-phosphate mannosyltransferase
MKKISIVIPVYFNAASLPTLFAELDRLAKGLAKIKLELELIFVDDGSKDSSLELLLGYKKGRKGVKVIKLTRNFGAVHASKTGIRYVSGDAFGILAADLQDPPPLVLEMAQRWKKGAKFVICERISREDPPMSKFFSRLFYFFLRLLVIRNYPVGGYDIALMDRSLLDPIIHSAKSVFTPLLAYWLGYEPEVIQYHRPARLHGKSGWTFAKKFNAFLDVMLGFSITPIRAISAVGSVVSVVSFGYGMVVTLGAVLGRIPVQGFATIVALITFLLGLIILMLGIIGEYLWRIFDETNRRPEVVIEAVY